MNAHELIDAKAQKAKDEVHLIAQRAIDAIKIKASYWIRSNAQQRRRAKA